MPALFCTYRLFSTFGYANHLFLRYPHALHHLELLQHAQFRSEIGKDEWREYLNQKQFDHWRTWYALVAFESIQYVEHSIGETDAVINRYRKP